MKLVKNNVAVLEVKQEEKKSAGGIVLAMKNDVRTPIKYHVVAVGPECKVVNEGDDILVQPRTGDTFTLDNTDYRVLCEDYILAIL